MEEETLAAPEPVALHFATPKDERFVALIGSSTSERFESKMTFERYGDETYHAKWSRVC